jgi:hypothetical protein
VAWFLIKHRDKLTFIVCEIYLEDGGGPFEIFSRTTDGPCAMNLGNSAQDYSVIEE